MPMHVGTGIKPADPDPHSSARPSDDASTIPTVQPPETGCRGGRATSSTPPTAISKREDSAVPSPKQSAAAAVEPTPTNLPDTTTNKTRPQPTNDPAPPDKMRKVKKQPSAEDILKSKIRNLESQTQDLTCQLDSVYEELREQLRRQINQSQTTTTTTSSNQAAAATQFSPQPENEPEPEPENEPENENEAEAEGIKPNASKILTSHITLLSRYNDIRDAACSLMGILADERGVRVGLVMRGFGVGGGEK